MKKLAFVLCVAGATLFFTGCKSTPREKEAVMGNPFWHIELMTSDVEKAKAFYGQLFDWKLQTAEGPCPYTLIDTGTPPGGGLMALPEPGIPVAWTVYVRVDDVEKTLEKAREFGGKVFKEKTQVPNVGWFAIIADPQGGVLGIWQEMNK